MPRKKKYIFPEIKKIEVKIADNILSSSVENFNSYIDSGNDDWGDTIIYPDDDIIW